MKEKKTTTLQGVHWWIILAFAFSLLAMGENAVRSPFSFIEYVLYLLVFFGLWNYKTHRREAEKRLRGIKSATGVYFSSAWVLGMLIESSITVNGEGVGGCHQHTLPSFILAQGIYVPLILTMAGITRRLSLTFPQAFYVAAGMGLVEALIFRPVALMTLFSPHFLLTPLSLGYGMNIYAKFLATPFLFMSPESIWRGDAGERSSFRLLLIGFLSGFILYSFWGAIYGPFVNWFFGFPPLSSDGILP